MRFRSCCLGVLLANVVSTVAPAAASFPVAVSLDSGSWDYRFQAIVDKSPISFSNGGTSTVHKTADVFETILVSTTGRKFIWHFQLTNDAGNNAAGYVTVNGNKSWRQAISGTVHTLVLADGSCTDVIVVWSPDHVSTIASLKRAATCPKE